MTHQRSVTKTKQYLQLARRHAFCQRKQIWSAWQREVLPAARQKREAHLTANRVWRMNTLRSSMQAWTAVGSIAVPRVLLAGAFDVPQYLCFHTFGVSDDAV